MIQKLTGNCWEVTVGVYSTYLGKDEMESLRDYFESGAYREDTE